MSYLLIVFFLVVVENRLCYSYLPTRQLAQELREHLRSFFSKNVQMFKGSKLENETKLKTVNEGNPTEVQLMQQQNILLTVKET